MDQDFSLNLQTQVKTAIEEKQSCVIRGGNSKYFYGNSVSATTILDIRPHQGIINYQPSELVITARAGTKLTEIENALRKNHQCLPFEPAHFGPDATLGGTIACGLSGSARPFKGSARDAVLGCKIINGHGDILRFGGEVVKNVAGYDVSRLITGSLGTLGLILDVSVKVMPTAPKIVTLVQAVSIENVIDTMNQLRRSTLPLSGVAFLDNKLYTRIEGSEASLSSAEKILGNNRLDDAPTFWHSLGEQRHNFFQSNRNLWQLFVPPATKNIVFAKQALIDWGGGQYWFFSDLPNKDIHRQASELKGHAVLFRRSEYEKSETFSTPNSGIFSLHQKIKQAFDPNDIFNTGKMYTSI